MSLIAVITQSPCSNLVAAHLEVLGLITTSVSSVKMQQSKPVAPNLSYSGSNMSPLAQRLMDSLDAENKMDFSKLDNLDAWSDHPHEDEPLDCPISGLTILTVGKYGRKQQDRIPVSEIYMKDKGYVKWIRDHIEEGPQTSKCMKKMRLYVEMRDNQKSQRIMMAMRSEASASGSQQVIVPKMGAVAKTKALSTPSRVRKQRDTDMELAEWEPIAEGNGQESIESISHNLIQAIQENPNPSPANQELLNNLMKSLKK